MTLLQESLIFFVLFLTINSANAALAPHHNNERKLSEMYYAYQERFVAPDVITIRVNEIEGVSGTGDGCPKRDRYTVEATVGSVEKGNLNVNEKITITYQRVYYLCPGPQTRSPKILVKGNNYSAYLKCNNKICSLKGDAWSFHSKKEFDDELDATIFKKKRWDERNK